MIRDKRKQDALDNILVQLLGIAKQIKTTLPEGWSKEYQLNMHQKYWLDPNRANIEGEEQFALQYESFDWILALEKQFALWVNAILKDKFNHIATYFDDAEITEWQREFSTAVKASQRSKEGIF